MVSLMVSLMVLPYICFSSTNSIAEPTKHTKGSHSETQHSPINKEAPKSYREASQGKTKGALDTQMQLEELVLYTKRVKTKTKGTR